MVLKPRQVCRLDSQLSTVTTWKAGDSNRSSWVHSHILRGGWSLPPSSLLSIPFFCCSPTLSFLRDHLSLLDFHLTLAFKFGGFSPSSGFLSMSYCQIGTRTPKLFRKQYLLACWQWLSRFISKGWAPRPKGSHLIYPCKQIAGAKSKVSPIYGCM
jgi:hypothetical protein